MKLLTAALMVVALTAASAKPTGRFQRQDADIRDKDAALTWRQMNESWSSESWESNPDSSESWESNSDSSESWESDSDSSESQESSEESSEEVFTDQTRPPVPPTTAMTTVSRGDGGTPTPDPDMSSTAGPTECFTEEIPTIVVITNNRGDN
ncbi:secretory calcium-binding phosphoprotein 8 [Genypterus blacodes]|uniref:secretory calcium-binding phosphoprotein 8 n=1 Tax=Genypterus blacodes TaxID=154954 RepID=UPI003F76CD78